MKKSYAVRPLVCIFILGWSVPVMAVRPACAFNALGHRVVAIVAERHLDAPAAAEVSRLLALEGKTSLSEVSSWADAIRDLKVPRQPAHSIKLLPEDGANDRAVFCDDGSCVTGAIKIYIGTLRNKQINDIAKLAALKYLVHFVGDLHQPLHAAVGERDIILDGRKRKLHEIWDATIINSLRMKDEEIADLIQGSSEARLGFSDHDVEGWAIEGREIVQDKILPDIGGFMPKWKQENLPPPELPHDYPTRHQEIVLDRLSMAGSRLAAVLNDVYRR